MDSQKGKPIHQVNYTLITSSPTDFGSETSGVGGGGLRFVLGLNSKRRYEAILIRGSVNYCTMKLSVKGRRSASRLSVLTKAADRGAANFALATLTRVNASRRSIPHHHHPPHPLRGAQLLLSQETPDLNRRWPIACCIDGGAGYLNIDYHILVCMRVTSGANQCQSPRSQQVNPLPPINKSCTLTSSRTVRKSRMEYELCEVRVCVCVPFPKMSSLCS